MCSSTYATLLNRGPRFRRRWMLETLLWSAAGRKIYSPTALHVLRCDPCAPPSLSLSAHGQSQPRREEDDTSAYGLIGSSSALHYLLSRASTWRWMELVVASLCADRELN